jgi:hypothetical protein
MSVFSQTAIGDTIFLVFESAFLYGVYRLGMWMYQHPKETAERFFHYDQFFKARKYTLNYLRAMGALFSWFSIFGVVILFESLLDLFAPGLRNLITTYVLILAWLFASFFIARRLRRSYRHNETAPVQHPS